MVKTNNTKFSAASVAKGSVVLSRAVEKNFALKAEISRLRHHVSVLFKRLHVVTLERRIFKDIVNQRQCPNCPGEGEPSGDVLAEEMGKVDATEEVADDRREVWPTCEEVAEEMMEDEPQQTVAVIVGLGKVEPQVAEPGMEVDGRYNRFALDLVPRDREESIWVPIITPGEFGDIAVKQHSGSPEGKWERMVTVFEEERSRIEKEATKKIVVGEVVGRNCSSGNEDAVIGEIIVAGGNSRKNKKKRNKKKRKSKATKEVEKEEEKEPEEVYEGLDLEGNKVEMTKEKWLAYEEKLKGLGYKVSMDYGGEEEIDDDEVEEWGMDTTGW